MGLVLVAGSLPFEGNETLQTAKTWCEFKAKASPGWYENAVERFKD